MICCQGVGQSQAFMLFTEAFPGSGCQLSSVLAPAKDPSCLDADDKVGKGHPGVMKLGYHLELHTVQS